MKRLRKILTLIVCCAVLMSGMTVTALAADGTIAFSDPETAVGDTVEIKCAVSTTTDTISSVDLTLKYDSESLKFESGDGVTKSQDGTLTYTGTGGSSEVSFTMSFQALKEGDAVVTVASSSVVGSSGVELGMEEGNSSVTIAAGDPSKIKTESTESTASGDGVKVDVGGKSYELSSDFADQDIPTGFEKATVKFEGADRSMVVNSNGTVYLAYLLDSDGVGDFFYYDSDKASFSQYELLKISDSASIVVIDESNVSVPSDYASTTLSLNGKDFSIWQDPDDSDCYILYAVNPDGEKGFYRYDSKDETYQRYEMPSGTDKTSTSDSKTSKAKGIFGKLRNLIDHYFTAFIIIMGVLLILLIIRLIVVRVKLRNRDLELDDLYDEYGIDLEDEEDEELLAPKKKKNDKNNKKNQKSQKNGPAVRKPQKTAQFDFEEDYDDYGELDYEEDDYDDEDDFEDIDSFDDEYEYDYDDEYDYEEDEYEEDDMIDDLDELLSGQPKKRRSHMEEDDTFKIDFVDID